MKIDEEILKFFFFSLQNRTVIIDKEKYDIKLLLTAMVVPVRR